MPAMSTDRTQLDFNLRLAPVQSEGHPLPSCRAIFSSLSSKPIGHTGSRYKPVQPSDCLAFGDALANRTGGTLSYSNMGDGRKSVIYCNLPNPLSIDRGKPSIKQVAFVNPNDGVGSAWCAGLITALWCDNQHAVVTGRRKNNNAVLTRIRIRHTASAPAMIREAVRILDQLLPKFTNEESTLAALLTKPIALAVKDHQPVGQLAAYYNAVIPLPTEPTKESIASAIAIKPDLTPDDIIASYNKRLAKVQSIHNCWLTTFLHDLDAKRTPSNPEPNAYLALNSVTDWAQHTRPLRSTTDRFESNLDGTGHELTVAAQSAALSHFLN